MKNTNKENTDKFTDNFHRRIMTRAFKLVFVLDSLNRYNYNKKKREMST